MHSNLVAKVEVEVDKLVTAGFIWQLQYPVWLANKVLVKRKNRQIKFALTSRTLIKLATKMTFQSLV